MKLSHFTIISLLFIVPLSACAGNNTTDSGNIVEGKKDNNIKISDITSREATSGRWKIQGRITEKHECLSPCQSSIQNFRTSKICTQSCIKGFTLEDANDPSQKIYIFTNKANDYRVSTDIVDIDITLVTHVPGNKPVFKALAAPKGSK